MKTRNLVTVIFSGKLSFDGKKLYFPHCQSEVAAKVDEKKDAVKGGGETILLVEDDHAVRKMAQTMLRRLGYVVIPTV